MSQQVQGQQAEQHETRIWTQPEHFVAEEAMWQAARVNTMTDSSRTDTSRQIMPDDFSVESGAEASGSGWAIDLQETCRLARLALTPPSLRRSADLIVSDRGAPAPNLGLRSLTVTLLCCLALLLVVGALDGMQQYARIHSQVDNALSHLLAAQSLLDARQPGQPLTAATLAQLDAQLSAAQSDFAELQGELGNPSGVVLLGRVVPHLSSRIASAADLARAGEEACQGLSDVTIAANDLLALRASGFLDASGQLTRKGRSSPLAATLLLHAQQALVAATSPLDAAAQAIAPGDLAVLPPTLASSANLATLSGMLASWPQTRSELLAPDGWRLLLPLVLGTQSPAH